ncbi:hypothetical protein WKW50_16670 [Ochrobactrum sp. GPK 3]
MSLGSFCLNFSCRLGEVRRTTSYVWKENHGSGWSDIFRSLKNRRSRFIQAKQVYIVVLHNSAEKVPEEFPNESFPFVEKLSRFPAREDNALKRNYWRLEKKDRQKVWAISKSYIEKWDSCMGKFPSGTPELPHDLVKFEKAGQILRVVCNKRV